MTRLGILRDQSLLQNFINPRYQVRELSILLPDRALYPHDSFLCLLNSFPGTMEVLKKCFRLLETSLETIDGCHTLLDLVIEPVGVSLGK